VTADGFRVTTQRPGFDPAPPARSAGSPAELAALVAAALPDAALLIDDGGRVAWGNPAASELFGLSLEDAVGVDCFDFVHPDDLQLAALSLTSMQDKTVGSLLELRVRNVHDGWRLVELRGTRFGEGVLLAIRDLTDRRRWEVAGDETALVRSLMQNATSITLLLRADRTVTGSSGGLTRLLGLDQAWLEGRDIADVVAEHDREVLASALYEVSRPGAHPLTVDLDLVDAEGRAVPFAITFTNLLDDPTVEGIVATGHDVSDRVRSEQELRAANSVLAATLESTTDGILVVDLEGRIVTFNRRLAQMWQVPVELLDQAESSRVMAAVLDQLVDPDAFVARVRELLAMPDAASSDLIRFRDGRIFERESMPQRIGGTVVGRVWSFRDMTEQVRLQTELIHQAFHDPLTGLANQALFRDRLTVAAARLGRHDGRLAVLFIDLDDFKTVNDSLGHSTGDELLRTVSQRIHSCLRPGDTAARLGGDEFAVLIDELASHEDAIGVAERILGVLQQPVELASAEVSAAASIGIAYGSGVDGVDELLRNADLAMYTAKAMGKNCYKVFADEMHAAALERLDLEARLRGAADRGELVVHYQPIFELASGRIAAMEALVRWEHPERGLLGPMSFIPFAEEGGLIDEIGHHVMVVAVEAACGWARQVGVDAPAVSVNLSPRQLLDAQLPDRVELLLHRTGLHPAQLILEITEGALMKDPAAATSSLERLSRLGVRLAVDDFGTGYSSLAYLQRFPIDLLKIDGSFVDDDLVDAGWSLAQAIVQISHALGLVPIAEGVETQAQADALAGFGCNLAQGYHLGRPVDPIAAAELIRDAAATAAGMSVDG
jgi:diguanylate cyclase (GGDEF)-like protein/PAS domain S-box-containing protein